MLDWNAHSLKPQYPPQRARWFLLAAAMIMLDQLTKFYFNQTFSLGESQVVIPGFFNFTLMYNTGAAFSFLAGAGGWQKYVLTLLALLICFWLSWNIFKRHWSTLMNCSGAFIIGGALGNVIDRSIHGYVIDFIQLYYKDWTYPVFNLADSFICIGAFLMVLDSFYAPPHQTSS